MSALKSSVKHTREALGSLTAVLFACAVPDRRQACSSTITGAGLLSRAGSRCNEGTSRRIVMLETGVGRLRGQSMVWGRPSPPSGRARLPTVCPQQIVDVRYV